MKLIWCNKKSLICELTCTTLFKTGFECRCKRGFKILSDQKKHGTGSVPNQFTVCYNNIQVKRTIYNKIVWFTMLINMYFNMVIIIRFISSHLLVIGYTFNDFKSLPIRNSVFISKQEVLRIVSYKMVAYIYLVTSAYFHW